VESYDVARAVDAAKAIAEALDLPAHAATVLHNSNKLALRLLPCDVFARVAPRAFGLARFEIELGQRLTVAGSPVAALEPRVEPRAYEHDGFEVSLWTYYETIKPQAPAADCAAALVRLHAGMRTIDVPTPHFTDRVADVEGNIASTPALDDADRDLLRTMLRDLERAVLDRGAPDQLLHGEPHAGNVLSTKFGPLFIDLETCCRGPVEFDLAHMPLAVGDHYPDVDRALLEDCRGLVLAVVAKHRCDPDDQFPNRQRALLDLIGALRSGPPWPALDDMPPQLDHGA
jgi:hypothetical protein